MKEILETTDQIPQKVIDIEKEAYDRMEATFKKALTPVHEKMWATMQAILKEPTHYKLSPTADKKIIAFIDFINTFSETDLERIKWAWQMLGWGRGQLTSHPVFRNMKPEFMYELQGIFILATGQDFEDVREEDELEEMD